MSYLVSDILSFYRNLEETFIKIYENLEHVSYKEQFLNLSAGLAATNSIHEMFIKSILRRHQNQYTISNTKYETLLKKYKSPVALKKFILALNLNLEEAFFLYLEELQKDFPHISTLDDIIGSIELQRTSRNKYLHGDFPLEGSLSLDLYESEVIKFRKLHFFLIKLIDYSYTKNYDIIPDLSLTC